MPKRSRLDAPITIEQAVKRYCEAKKHTTDYTNIEHDGAAIIEYFAKVAKKPNKKLASLSDADIEALVKWKQRQPRWGDPALGFVSTARVNRSTTQFLRRVTLHAIGLGSVVKKVPDWKRWVLKEPVKRKRVLSGDEHAAILAEIDPDYAVLLQFALVTGLRQTSSLLLWANVNFETKTYGYIGKGGHYLEKRMTPEAERILRSRVGHHPTYVFTYVTKRHHRDDPLPGSRAPITGTGLRSVWDRVKARLGIAGLKWHDLRRTFGSHVHKMTKDLALVQDLMDHADPKTTRRYIVIEDDYAVEQVALAEQTFAARFPIPATTNEAGT